MRFIDLTHPVATGMPVFPGDPEVRLIPAASVEKEGFRVTSVALGTHAGTHADAPAHVFAGGKPLSDFPISAFSGTALVVPCEDLPPGGLITMERIEAAGEAAREAEFLLFRTGWERFWGRDAYFRGYPVITAEVARWIAASGKKGAGFDAPGIDPEEDAGLTLHRIVLGTRRTVIIENLANLSAPGLDSGLFAFRAAPLALAGTDGAPVRAWAELP